MKEKREVNRKLMKFEMEKDNKILILRDKKILTITFKDSAEANYISEKCIRNQELINKNFNNSKK
jgi:hypothetical protein